jgi:hypothetical protein
LSITLIILPIFALILLGTLLKRVSGVTEDGWRGLERLIYFVFFPALLFHSLSRAQIDFGAALPMLFTGLLVTLIGMGLGYLSKSLFRDPPKVFASAFQCSFRFNSYIGLAVAGALHGQAGIAALGLLMGFIVPLANVASVAVLARHGDANWLREILGNPLIMATAGGVAFALLGWSLPDILNQTIGLAGPGIPAHRPGGGGRRPASGQLVPCPGPPLVWRHGEAAGAARHGLVDRRPVRAFRPSLRDRPPVRGAARIHRRLRPGRAHGRRWTHHRDPGCRHHPALHGHPAPLAGLGKNLNSRHSESDR